MKSTAIISCFNKRIFVWIRENIFDILDYFKEVGNKEGMIHLSYKPTRSWSRSC